MENNTKERQVLQWHPAFYAEIQIEFEEDADKLIFENEHQLGTNPKEIDVLFIKKNSEERIKKNIGRIFRTHNILEYKSPDDYLSVDDFYKVYGYACFYKSDVHEVNAIKADDISITFVCYRYPGKLITHLTEERHWNVSETDEGIYYIDGDIFPMQIILTSRLSKETNFWLRNLTDDLRDNETAKELISEYEKHKDSGLYKSVMDIIVRANQNKFQEVKHMCDALRELMEPEFTEMKEQAMAEGHAEGLAEGRAEGLAEGREEGKDVKLITQISKKLQKGKNISTIAEELEEEPEIVERICEAVKECAPNSDAETIYKRLKKMIACL